MMFFNKLKSWVNFASFLIIIILFSSCSSNESLVKKFIGRMNAKEYNSASAYIYPGDHPKLRLFCDVMDKNPNMQIKVLEENSCEIEGKQAVVVKLEFINTMQYFRNYMSDRYKVINEDPVMVDTFYIKEYEKGECLSFDWVNITGEDLQSASIEKNHNRINIRQAPNKKSHVLVIMEKTDNIVIDNYSKTDWVKCFYMNNQCNLVTGYIYKPYLKSSSSDFFNLSWFDKMGLLLAITILALVVIVPLFLSSIIRALTGDPYTAVFGIVLLILLPLYVAYQLIEHIVFELFLYNLPY